MARIQECWCLPSGFDTREEQYIQAFGEGMKNLRTLLPDELVIVSSGDYSDYGLHGVFKVTQTINLEKELADYLATNPEEAKRYGFTERKFLNELTKSGALDQLHYTELFLGDYGVVDGVEVRESGKCSEDC